MTYRPTCHIFAARHASISSACDPQLARIAFRSFVQTVRIQLSVHRADRGHPNESDVCDQFLPYFGGTTAVSSLNLGRDNARPSNGFRHSPSHMLDYVIAELRAFDLGRPLHQPRGILGDAFARDSAV